MYQTLKTKNLDVDGSTLTFLGLDMTRPDHRTRVAMKFALSLMNENRACIAAKQYIITSSQLHKTWVYTSPRPSMQWGINKSYSHLK
jgi:hypothetical protein